MFGIGSDFIDNGQLVIIDEIENNKLANVVDFFRLWNTNTSFLDNEEIWQRGRQSITSNFIHRLLVTSEFIRSTDTYNELNRLRRLPGINYIDLDCCEEDIVLTLEIGAETEEQLHTCVKNVQSAFNLHLDSLTVHRYGHDNTRNSEYCLPYACAVLHKSLRKDKYSDLACNVETLSRDPEVTFVELNEVEHTLTLGCTSQASLDRLLFEVRGRISFFKISAWRKKYHGNFRFHIKATDDQIMMDAIFEDIHEQILLSSDFTDFTTTAASLRFMKLQESASKVRLNRNPYVTSSYTLYSPSSMMTKFNIFVGFDDFPKLTNIGAYIRFGTTLYKVKGLPNRPNRVSSLLDYWEKGFNAEFSFDIYSSFKEILGSCLSAEGCTEVSQESFAEVFFRDLGNNFRFMARIYSDQPSLDSAIEVNYCRMDHIHYRVIDIDCSKCSKQIIVSSQKSCDNVRAKDFVEDSIRSGELLAENVMSLNSYYSMYNVSIVKRTVLQYRDFIIHLDSVSKKSNQRYGKFSDVVHLTLYYPRLNETICQLQENPGDESLMKCAAELYEELISASDRFSAVIDRFIESS